MLSKWGNKQITDKVDNMLEEMNNGWASMESGMANYFPAHLKLKDMKQSADLLVDKGMLLKKTIEGVDYYKITDFGNRVAEYAERQNASNNIKRTNTKHTK